MSAQQLFLSYCHRDNEPFGPGQRRWVEEFENALSASLGQRLGPGRIEIWRDKKLGGNELFDASIAEQLDRSAIFVTVLSQHYLSSPYCRQELVTFGQLRKAGGGLQIEHLSRIVKVFRLAIDRADLRRFVADPELEGEVDGTVGYELYYRDLKGVDRDLLLDPQQTVLYWQRSDDIAVAIKRMLDATTALPKSDMLPVPDAAEPRRPTPSRAGIEGSVYLATTSRDMRPIREALQRELEDRNYRVLPDELLPEDADAFSKVVSENLKAVALSVHLIGSRYGSIPEGTDKSGVELQADLALGNSAKNFRSIFWSPNDLTVQGPNEPRQLEFLNRLEEAKFQLGRAEFVRSSVEQLRTLVRDKLRPATTPTRPAPPVSPRVDDDGDVRSLYLICDSVDRADAKPLHAALSALGFTVELPSAEGTIEELLEEHKANLVNCDTVVVVWGKSRETWVRSKFREVQQSPGWGRTRPFAGKFIVIAPPDSEAKSDFVPPHGVVPVSIEKLQEIFS